MEVLPTRGAWQNSSGDDIASDEGNAIGSPNGDDGGDGDDGSEDDDGGDSDSDNDDDGSSDEDDLRTIYDNNPIAVAFRKLRVGGKPNLKQLSINSFTGTILPGEFDSNVRAWWTEFNGQMLGAQLRDNHRWSELIKCSFLQACLKGDASKWFDRAWMSKSKLSLQQAGKLLIRQYSTKIDEDAIRDKIRGANKRPSESYEMFSQRLQNMADSLPGGVGKRSSAKAALSAFVNRACPRQTTQLEFWLSTRTQKIRPHAALDKLVGLLGRLTKSDGVSADSHNPKKTHTAAAVDKGPFAAMATVVDRKRKNRRGDGDRPSKYGPFVQPACVTDNTLCHKCKGRGHIARDPRVPYKSTKKVSPLELAVKKAIEEDSA